LLLKVISAAGVQASAITVIIVSTPDIIIGLANAHSINGIDFYTMIRVGNIGRFATTKHNHWLARRYV
jgi:hypothetical protein